MDRESSCCLDARLNWPKFPADVPHPIALAMLSRCDHFMRQEMRLRGAIHRDWEIRSQSKAIDSNARAFVCSNASRLERLVC